MNFDEEEDEEDADSSSSSQLNSNTRPGSATSKKSSKVSKGSVLKKEHVGHCTASVQSTVRIGLVFFVVFSICTTASLS